MITHFSKIERSYTGVELRPHFLLTELGLKGDALAAFIGSCAVKTEQLVDWEDRLAHQWIEARWMVHFLGEFFGTSLKESVLYQRLLAGLMVETLNHQLLQLGQNSFQVLRKGDDLFVGARKLSVSIVTSSPVSQLLHFGVNIDPLGAPVPAMGLAELGIHPEGWVPEVLSRFSQERQQIEWACTKVRPVL